MSKKKFDALVKAISGKPGVRNAWAVATAVAKKKK